MLNGDDLPPLLHGHYPASTLLRGSPPLSGASVLSASRLEPLVPFPLASPARFSRSVQVDHRHCRPAANETVLGLRRAVGTEVVHWLGANKPAYKLDPGGGHGISMPNRDRGTAGSLWHGLSK